MGDREEALRLAREWIARGTGVQALKIARALLAAEAEIERLRHRVLTPLTEADVVAALHNGYAERRAAQGDNAWASLLGERDELRAEVERLRGFVSEIAEYDCTYNDGCPAFGSRHGTCVGCKARRALEPAIAEAM